MKTLTIISKFKDYWNNYLPLSKRQAITWLLKIEKELKALEIIKKKEVDSQYLIRLWTTSEKSDKDILWKFNWYIRLEENKLTQEEYDLLKEVLL